jgi:4-oxalomesaconate tautomerase
VKRRDARRPSSGPRDLDIEGTETPEVLETDDVLRSGLEAIRTLAGPAMGLGDVGATTVPKISILSGPHRGGTVTTRTFIPHRVHPAIGVLGAVSVAAGVMTRGTVASRPTGDGGLVRIEHPTGFLRRVPWNWTATALSPGCEDPPSFRTARKLSDGLVWPRSGKAIGCRSPSGQPPPQAARPRARLRLATWTASS